MPTGANEDPGRGLHRVANPKTSGRVTYGWNRSRGITREPCAIVFWTLSTSNSVVDYHVSVLANLSPPVLSRSRCFHRYQAGARLRPQSNVLIESMTLGRRNRKVFECEPFLTERNGGW